ncbi:GntR family transcriptional regulator [Methylobacterium sp. CM6257]
MLERPDPMFRVTALKRATSLRTLAYDAIRQSIITTDPWSDPGEIQLDERRIARDLGISRTPVREALMLLEREGFVRSVPRRGTIMVRKTKREILDIIAVWAALESAAAASAAGAASDAQLAALGGEFQALTSANLADQLQDYSQANLTFHQTIIQLGGCGLMAEMAGDLFVHVRAIRTRAIHQADRAERSLREHAAIITALRARDAERAAILVRDHALGLATHVEEHWAFPEK